MNYGGICGRQRQLGLVANTAKGTVVRPRCNRIPGHHGPHRKVDRQSFAILAEWGDEECVVERGR